MRMLEVNNLTIKYGSTEIIHNISFSVDEGQWLMIVGPNGAGKSTILNAISRGIKYDGSIMYKNTDICKMRPYELARHIGILSQNHSVGYDFTVGEIVNLGRYAYRRGNADNSCSNEEAVQRALEETGLVSMEHKSILALSGGEVQRTFLAQLFAQNPDIMILDEPANHLDLIYQKQVFELISDWLKQPGRSVISVVHDLSLARAYGTHCILISDGGIASCGTADQVLTPDSLEKAYGMDVYGWMKKMLGQWNK